MAEGEKMTFFRMLKSDFRRLFQAKNFYFVVLLVAFITAVGLVPDIWVYRSSLSVFGLVQFHGSATSFFLIMTVLAAFPFGLSYREDVRHNYIHGIISRVGDSAYCWSHVIVTATGAFLAVFLGYALCYLVMGLFFPMIHGEEAEALLKSSRNVYTDLMLGPTPVLYFVCAISTEAVGYAFLAVFALMLSPKIENPFVLLSSPALSYYGSVVACGVLELHGIARWYNILSRGGWLAEKIADIRFLMPCVFLYFGSLICLEGLVFLSWVERRRIHG